MQSNPASEDDRYRDSARQLRLDAERASDPAFRRQLLDIAAQYDMLAEVTERSPRSARSDSR